MSDSSFPRYADLRRPDATGLPLAAGVWGPEDELGMLNHVTPAKALEAARTVTDGRRFNLDLPLDLPLGVLPAGSHRLRLPPRHTVYKSDTPERMHRDDKLDDFFLQGSSQWDGLTHIGDGTHGFYNGARDEQTASIENSRNGINRVAEFCLFTRGILVDLPVYFSEIGRDWSLLGSRVISASDLSECLAWQRTTLKPGDALLLRFGWTSAFFDGDAAARERLFRGPDYSGLAGDEAMWAFLWDHRVAAVAADNVTVEALPKRAGQPGLHGAIPRLGFTLGELFYLDDLARACTESRRYEFLFVSKPLNLRGGVGSPPNAMAVF